MNERRVLFLEAAMAHVRPAKRRTYGCVIQWGKQNASHLGGTGNLMVVAQPMRISARGELGSQFTDCIDNGPTFLNIHLADDRTETLVSGRFPETNACQVADPD